MPSPGACAPSAQVDEPGAVASNLLCEAAALLPARVVGETRTWVLNQYALAHASRPFLHAVSPLEQRLLQAAVTHRLDAYRLEYALRARHALPTVRAKLVLMQYLVEAVDGAQPACSLPPALCAVQVAWCLVQAASAKLIGTLQALRHGLL